MGYTSPCLCRGILITTDPFCLSGHVSCRVRGHPLDTPSLCLCRGILITTDPLCLSGHVSCRVRGHPWDTPSLCLCRTIVLYTHYTRPFLFVYPIELETTHGHGIHKSLVFEKYTLSSTQIHSHPHILHTLLHTQCYILIIFLFSTFRNPL